MGILVKIFKMNLIKGPLFFLIRLYTLPLRIPILMQLSFQKVLRKQFWRYYDTVFLNDYPHIRRACNLLADTKSPVIFDIGGGQGTTLKIFNKELPNARISLFEPIAENYSIIQKQFGQVANLSLYNLAAGDKAEEAIIHVADRITSSSLHQLNPGAHSKDSYLAQALTPSREEKIQVVRLESYLVESKKTDLLKLDVQGFELNVLKGCGEALKTVRYILLEVSNHHGYENAELYYEIDAFMRSNGFEIADLFPGIKEGGFLKEWD